MIGLSYINVEQLDYLDHGWTWSLGPRTSPDNQIRNVSQVVCSLSGHAITLFVRVQGKLKRRLSKPSQTCYNWIDLDTLTALASVTSIILGLL